MRRSGSIRDAAMPMRVPAGESMGSRGDQRTQSPARLVALLPSASRRARNFHAGAGTSVSAGPRRENWRSRGSGRSWRVEFVRVGLYVVAAAWGPSASKAVGGDARRNNRSSKLRTDRQPAARRRSGERRASPGITFPEIIFSCNVWHCFASHELHYIIWCDPSQYCLLVMSYVKLSHFDGLG